MILTLFVVILSSYFKHFFQQPLTFTFCMIYRSAPAAGAPADGGSQGPPNLTSNRRLQQTQAQVDEVSPSQSHVTHFPLVKGSNLRTNGNFGNNTCLKPWFDMKLIITYILQSICVLSVRLIESSSLYSWLWVHFEYLSPGGGYHACKRGQGSGAWSEAVRTGRQGWCPAGWSVSVWDQRCKTEE